MKIAYAYPVNGVPPRANSNNQASLNKGEARANLAKTDTPESPVATIHGKSLDEVPEIRDILNNPFKFRKDVQQHDGAIFTNSKEHAEKMKQAGVKAHYVSDKIQQVADEWGANVFAFNGHRGYDSYPHFISILKQVNQLEKKFGLDDFSLNFKLQNDKLVISHPKLDEQLKTRLEEELNKDELGVKSHFKTLLNYTGDAAYRHLLQTNGTTYWNKFEGDFEAAHLTAFAAVVTERFEKTGKIELPPVKSPYGSNNLTHLSLRDFYLHKSDLKTILNGNVHGFTNHFGRLYVQTTEHMLEHLDAKQYVLHDRFGYLNYIKKGSTVNETA